MNNIRMTDIKKKGTGDAKWKESTIKFIAYGYAESDPDDVANAYKIAMTDARAEKNVNVGAISAEEGMGTALSEKRDTVCIYVNRCVRIL